MSYYDASREHAPLARSKDYNGAHPRPRIRQALHRQEQGVHRQGPNVRTQGSGNVSIKLAAGGTSTLTSSGRKNGNGAFYRNRDGKCVSHVLA